MSRHLLLTGLGLNPREGEYCLADDEKPCPALLAPVALLKLLAPEKQPDQVLAFCTKDALAQTFPSLRDLLQGLAAVEAVEVPDGINPKDIDQFLECAVKAVVRHSPARLTLDLTQGPRHFALLLYLGGLYLESLGNIKIEAAYYAYEFETPRPFFDLKALLELPRWIHAIDTLKESRDALPLAGLLRRAERKAPHLGQFAQWMGLATEAFASGLPLELGRVAERLLREMPKPLRRALREEFRLPLAERITGKLDEWLAAYRLDEPAAGQGWKAEIELTERELQRQATLIDDLLAHGNLRSALGLMNEWVVSWAVLGCGEGTSWLEFKPVRRRAANRLDALFRRQQDPGLRSRLCPEQQALARFWESLTSLRNSLHHHGMRPQAVASDDDAFKAKLDAVRRFWESTMRRLPSISLEPIGSGERSLLVSPVGERPGVLYSALLGLNREGFSCDAVLAICSRSTEPRVAEAFERAGWHGEHHLLRFDDPFAGIEERPKLCEQARLSLAQAGSVYVNVTGGTTLMGLLAEELAGEARRLARPVRRFGLIDRRPSEQQRTNPWVQGELLWLDKEADAES